MFTPNKESESEVGMDLNLFNYISEKYGSVGSWAVWGPLGDKPKSNIGDMSVLDPSINAKLLSLLKEDVVMVGLNFSREVRFEKPFQNFHDKSRYANDFKIRYAFLNTPYYGAYMTDLIKTLTLSSSKDVVSYLKDNPDIVEQNIIVFQRELSDIQSHKPLLIAFGNDVYSLLKASLDDSFYSGLIKVTHYSHQISKENYREKVFDQIASYLDEKRSNIDYLYKVRNQLQAFSLKLEKLSPSHYEELNLLSELDSDITRLQRILQSKIPR